MKQGWAVIVWVVVKFILPVVAVYWIALVLFGLILPVAPELHHILAAILTGWVTFAGFPRNA